MDDLVPPPVPAENITKPSITPKDNLNIKGFLILTCIFIFIYFFIRLITSSVILKNQPQSSPPLSPIISDISGWKIWSDELNTYWIQTPAHWEWITHSSNFINMHFITLKAPDGSIFQASAVEISSPTLTAYLQDKDQKNATGWEGQPSKNIISSKKVLVGNHSGIERVEDWLAAGYVTLVTYLKDGDYVYEFSIQPSEIEYTGSEVFKNYHQILSSFKLQSTSPPPGPENRFCGGIAGIACPPGFKCKLDGNYPDSGGTCRAVSGFVPTITPAPVTKTKCKIGGCSGELCLDVDSPDVASTCIYRDEYACYKNSICEKQSNGKCSWTQTREYLSCIQNLKVNI